MPLNRSKNKEYFLFKNLIKKDNLYYLNAKIQNKYSLIGTFLLEFLNTNFKDSSICKEFILKYTFETLFDKTYPDMKKQYTSKMSPPTLNVSKINDMLDIFCTEEQDSFLYAQSVFLRYFGLPDNTGVMEKVNEELKKLGEPVDDEDESDSRNELSLDSFIKGLSLNFDKFIFYFAETDLDEIFSEYVPYAFKSNEISDILIISIKEFKTKKNATIRQCQNCSKYFIPENLNNTKYCNNIFKKQ